MQKNAFRLIAIYTLIFSSPLLIDIFFKNLGTFIRFSLVCFLWIISFGIVRVRKRLSKQERKLPDTILLILTNVLSIIALVSIYREIPIAIIIFSLSLYLSFYPLIYLMIYIRKNDLLFKKMLLFLIILVNLMSLGIIWDSQGGLFQMPFIGDRLEEIRQEQIEENRLRNSYIFIGDQKRGSFLIGSSTGLFPFLSIGCLANILFFTLFPQKNKNITLLAIPNFAIISTASFFTFSRTPLLLTVAMCLYGLTDIYNIGRLKNLFHQWSLVFLVFLLVLIIPEMSSVVFVYITPEALTKFQQGFLSDSSNIVRYQAWQEGISLFADFDSWLGYGAGTSSIGSRNILDNKLIRPHYESTLLSDFSESGLLGLVARLLPYLVIIMIAKQVPKSGVFMVWSCLIILNLFLAPIGGYNTLFPSFLAIGLCLSLRKIK